MQVALKFPISLFLSRTNTYKFQVGSNFPPFSSLWAHSALGSPHTQHGRVKLIRLRVKKPRFLVQCWDSALPLQGAWVLSLLGN